MNTKKFTKLTIVSLLSVILMLCGMQVALAVDQPASVVVAGDFVLSISPGTNIGVLCGVEVILDASDSVTISGAAITSYEWRFVSVPWGSAAVLSDASSAVTTIVPDELGDYIVGLTVGDGNGFSSEALITVNTKPLGADTDDVNLRGVSGPIRLDYSFKNSVPLADGWIITADSSNKL